MVMRTGGVGGSVYNPAAVAITGGTIDGTVIGGSTPAAATGTVVTATTKMLIPDGSVGTPGIGFTSMDDGTGTGIYSSSGGIMDFAANGIRTLAIGNNSVFIIGSAGVVWGTSNDTAVVRAAANSLQFGTTSATTTSRTEMNKAVASIADATPTAVLTITIPNAAHSASVLVRVTGSLGAGGAIGANEATASNTYIVTLTRTAGVNATAAISSAFGSAATAVAGAATVTATAAMSAVSGAVGATNTFTVNVTITRSGGSSTNHTCLVYAQLMNANATGITIS